MANRTVKEAKSVKGTNPQYLVEKIIRTRIYDCQYWKEKCFALSAELLVDEAMSLEHIGGVFGGNIKPTPFLCLILKMLQIQPSKDIIIEFIKNPDYKYVRILGSMYLRLVGTSVECYKYLEPLYNDYRKLKFKNRQGKLTLTHVDEFIDDLLRSDRVCDVILPRLQKRHILEETEQLEPRVSALDEDLEGEESDEEEDEEEEEEEVEHRRRSRSPRYHRRHSRSPYRSRRSRSRSRSPYRRRSRSRSRSPRYRNRKRSYSRSPVRHDRHSRRSPSPYSQRHRRSSYSPESRKDKRGRGRRGEEDEGGEERRSGRDKRREDDDDYRSGREKERHRDKEGKKSKKDKSSKKEKKSRKKEKEKTSNSSTSGSKAAGATTAEELEIQAANELRAELGLKPLRLD